MSRLTSRRNLVMFAVGLMMAVGAAVMMVVTDDESSSFVPLGVMGLVFIAVSRRSRPHL